MVKEIGSWVMCFFTMDKDRGKGDRQILLALPVIMILMDQVGCLLLLKAETVI
jgi:hypothetical protein